MMKTLADDSRTGAVWSVGGVIKFKLANGTAIKKVQDVFSSIEEILS